MRFLPIDCLSFSGFGTYLWDVLCKRPIEVLDRCNEDRFSPVLKRFEAGFPNGELRFDGMTPRIFLPDAVLSSPMAPAAEPSFSAAFSNSLRASLSHQNSHDLESLDRPFDTLFVLPSVDRLDGGWPTLSFSGSRIV